MCYDISFTINLKQVEDYFPDLIYDDQIEINFDPVHIMGHNYGEHPIIFRNREDELLHCRLMEWGCIPFYIKDAEAFQKKGRQWMLNARSEKILGDTSSYWNKIKDRRCLIPVSGFYEHRKVKGFTKKIPYYLQLKKQEIFFLPGLYSVAEIPDKETGELQKVFSFTIVTRDANSLMKQIHNGGDNSGRMPLMLPLELSEKWMQQELTGNEYRQILDFEMPADEMTYHTVFTIRSPKERPDAKAKNEFWDWGDKLELVEF